MRIAFLIALGALVTGVACSQDEAIPSVPPTPEGSTAVESPSEPSAADTGGSNETPSLESALEAIGAKCDQLVGDTDCKVDGMSFTVSVVDPGKWNQNEALRDKACDQGFVNPGYVIATDGESFTLASDFNDETKAIAASMSEAGLDLDVVTYCP